MAYNIDQSPTPRNPAYVSRERLMNRNKLLNCRHSSAIGKAYIYISTKSPLRRLSLPSIMRLYPSYETSQRTMSHVLVRPSGPLSDCVDYTHNPQSCYSPNSGCTLCWSKWRRELQDPSRSRHSGSGGPSRALLSTLFERHRGNCSPRGKSWLDSCL